MNDKASAVPLSELVRSVPRDLRGVWEIQWFEDGTPCGHSHAPVGRYLHEQADEIERLTALLKYGRRPGKSNLPYIQRIAELEANLKLCNESCGEWADENERLQARVDELEERIEKLLASKFAASSPKLIAKIITLASEVET